jgi:hypothetical protein
VIVEDAAFLGGEVVDPLGGDLIEDGVDGRGWRGGGRIRAGTLLTRRCCTGGLLGRGSAVVGLARTS